MTGNEMVALAQKHIGEKYVLGAFVPKNIQNYTGPWDCAEFVSWVVYQVCGKLYGCANDNGSPDNADAFTGFWKRDADSLGKIISVTEAARIPGAAILRYAGNGLVGHIVISDGRGGTIEAHSSKTGVIKNVVSGRRWDTGILVPWISYAALTSPVSIMTPLSTIYRLTIPMMQGDKIKEIQKGLERFGFKVDEDGIYGSETFFAVKNFQNKSGLVADGEVGEKTAMALGISI